MQVYVGSGSDIGRVRKSNQDAVDVDPQSGFFIVADGTGGHEGGEIASSIVVSVTKEFVAAAGSAYEERKAALVGAVREANARIYQQAVAENKLGMSSTCTAFLIGFGKYFVAHVGDSRAYLIRGTDIFQITKDHSHVQELVDRGIITPEEARHHENKNVVTRTVGIGPEVEVDTFEGEFRETDVLLACSDGLWGLVTDREIADTVIGSEDGPQACKALIEMANRNGGHDNISVVLAQSCPTMTRVLPPRPATTPRRFRPVLRRKGVIVGAGGVVVLAALAVIFQSKLLDSPPPTSTWVRFKTTPETLEAALARTGKTLPVVTNESLNLRLRDVLIFRRPGYHDDTLVINDLAQRERPIELRQILVPVSFGLSSGTEITFNDGKKARSRESLPFGSYALSCTRPGYQPCETTLKIADARDVVFNPVFSSEPASPTHGSSKAASAAPPPSSSRTVTVRFTATKRGEKVRGAMIIVDGVATGKSVPDAVVLDREKQHQVVLRCVDGTSSRPRDLIEIRDPSSLE